MAAVSDKPVLAFDTVEEWERWLAANPGTDGVRLRLHLDFELVLLNRAVAFERDAIDDL